MRRTRPGRLATAVAGCVAVVLAGCSGGGGAATGTSAAASSAASAATTSAASPPAAPTPTATPSARATDPETLVAAAYATTVAAGSARFVSTSVSPDGSGGTVRATGPGLVDFARFRLRQDQAIRTTGGSVPGTERIRRRQIEEKSWVAGRPELQADPSKTWLLDTILLPAVLTRGGHMEQIPELARLRGLGAPVTVVGPQRVGGVDTVHYRGTCSVARIMAPEPEPKPVVEELIRYLDGTTADVWLDADGRIRRAVVAGMPGVEVRFDLSDFGVPVTVTPPPSSDTEVRGP